MTLAKARVIFYINTQNLSEKPDERDKYHLLTDMSEGQPHTMPMPANSSIVILAICKTSFYNEKIMPIDF
jgi:hypothetical protein